jgi:GNAT superfamily N-acetyltransferase
MNLFSIFYGVRAGMKNIHRKKSPAMADFILRPVGEQDKEWVRRLIRERWAADFIFVHGELFHPDELPGFTAQRGAVKIGLATYRIAGKKCEIITLDSLEPGHGIGGALIDAVKEAAIRSGCRRLWLVTTNDNLHALRFYQRKGFTLCALRPNVIAEIRKRKPVPQLGEDNIPIRDEIELEMQLRPI